MSYVVSFKSNVGRWGATVVVGCEERVWEFGSWIEAYAHFREDGDALAALRAAESEWMLEMAW